MGNKEYITYPVWEEFSLHKDQFKEPGEYSSYYNLFLGWKITGTTASILLRREAFHGELSPELKKDPEKLKELFQFPEWVKKAIGETVLIQGVFANGSDLGSDIERFKVIKWMNIPDRTIDEYKGYMKYYSKNGGDPLPVTEELTTKGYSHLSFTANNPGSIPQFRGSGVDYRYISRNGFSELRVLSKKTEFVDDENYPLYTTPDGMLFRVVCYRGTIYTQGAGLEIQSPVIK